MKVKPLLLATAMAIAAPAVIVSSHPAAMASTAGTAAYSPTSPMVFVTANIGRTYGSASEVSGAMERIRSNLNDVSNGRPRYIGWQEIDEDDDANEMKILKDTYQYDSGWDRTLYRPLDDGTQAPLKVPAVAHDAQKSDQRIVYGSAGLEGASPTRWITITRFGNQNISLVNTHFIADAYDGCAKKCPEKLERWNNLWDKLKEQVAREHNAGYNVVLTADFNRLTVEDGWSPSRVHGDAKTVKSGRRDYIVAIPRDGWKVVKLRNADGSFKQGEWRIGIDGHEAHWVKLQFLAK